jgi:programmed cell death protein 5
MDEDSELEKLKEKKMRELERQAKQKEADDSRRDKAEAQKKALLRQVLDSEARQRLERIRMARPEKAERIEQQLIQLAASGRLNQKLSDEQLKQILAKSQSDDREINIERR